MLVGGQTPTSLGPQQGSVAQVVGKARHVGHDAHRLTLGCLRVQVAEINHR